MQPAVFIDRDGVINEDKGYVFRQDDLVLLPSVPNAMKRLKDRGYLLIIITNQSGIARGYFTLNDVDIFHEALQKEISALGGPQWDALYLCPHHPEGTIADFAQDCSCRKPKPGLLELARADFQIDWGKSFLIGDKDSDIACGQAVGIRTIRIDSQQYQQQSKADFLAKDLGEAADLILSNFA